MAGNYPLPQVGDMTVRAYGGWWREEAASDARFSAAVQYSEHCPALLATAGRYWRVRFEFADDLLLPADPAVGSPSIRHTVAMRPPPPLAISQVHGAVCTEDGCEVQRCRRWLYRRRGCTRSACPQQFGQVWIRTEQKQVDTHLAVDLLQLTRLWPRPIHISLLSDDIDFLPAIVAAATTSPLPESITHVRVTGRRTYLDPFLTERGVRILSP